MAAATLTKAMLEDLHKGSATVSIIPYVAGGVNFASMTFKDSNQLYTLAGSLTLSPEDAETNTIKIDQLDETIDFDMNEGNWQVNGNIPTIAAEVLSYFFEEGETIATGTEVIGPDDTKYTGKAYGKAKFIEVSMLLTSESKQTAIALARVKLAVNPPAIDDMDTPAYLKMTGYVLVNPKGGKFSVLKASAGE